MFYARKYLYNPTFSCFLFYESNFYVTKLFNQPIGAKMFDCHAAPRLKKKKIGACQKFYILFSLEQTPPPPPPLKIYNKCSMTLHSHNPDFCSDFCILILNIAQNFHCACATNLWMHALFTAERQHSPNYFLIFQSSSVFLLLVPALSRLVVGKHKLFNSLERQ